MAIEAEYRAVCDANESPKCEHSSITFSSRESLVRTINIMGWRSVDDKLICPDCVEVNRGSS